MKKTWVAACVVLMFVAVLIMSGCANLKEGRSVTGGEGYAKPGMNMGTSTTPASPKVTGGEGYTKPGIDQGAATTPATPKVTGGEGYTKPGVQPPAAQ